MPQLAWYGRVRGDWGPSLANGGGPGPIAGGDTPSPIGGGIGGRVRAVVCMTGRPGVWPGQRTPGPVQCFPGEDSMPASSSVNSTSVR